MALDDARELASRDFLVKYLLLLLELVLLAVHLAHSSILDHVEELLATLQNVLKLSEALRALNLLQDLQPLSVQIFLQLREIIGRHRAELPLDHLGVQLFELLHVFVVLLEGGHEFPIQLF